MSPGPVVGRGPGLALALVLVSGGVLAAPPPTEVRRLYDAATAAFRAGRFEEAAKTFEAAHAVEARPSLLYNEALAWERAGHLPEAADAMGRFSSVAPAAEAKLARRWLDGVEVRLAKTHARVEIGCATTVELSVDGVHRPCPVAAWLPAGDHRLDATSPGYEPRSETLALTAGHTHRAFVTLRPVAHEAELVEAPAAPRGLVSATVTPAGDEPDDTAAIALLGSGGGLVVVGAVLHLGVALPLAQQLDDLDPARGDYDAAFDARADVIDGVLVGAWVSYGLGVGLAVTGAILMATGHEPDTEVLVGVGADGVLTVQGRF